MRIMKRLGDNREVHYPTLAMDASETLRSIWLTRVRHMDVATSAPSERQLIPEPLRQKLGTRYGIAREAAGNSPMFTFIDFDYSVQ